MDAAAYGSQRKRRTAINSPPAVHAAIATRSPGCQPPPGVKALPNELTMCESGKKCDTETSQPGAPSSGNQMPEMNETGRKVSWATGVAWSADLTRLATATPSADRHSAPSASVTIASGSREE